MATVISELNRVEIPGIRFSYTGGRVRLHATPGVESDSIEEAKNRLYACPMSSNQFIEIPDIGQDLLGLAEALRDQGLPIRGVSRMGLYPGNLYVICGTEEAGAEGDPVYRDASPEELRVIEQEARKTVNPARPKFIVKEELRGVLQELATLLREPEIFAEEILDLTAKRNQLKLELGK